MQNVLKPFLSEHQDEGMVRISVVYEILWSVSESLSQSVDLALILIDKILTTILNSHVVNAAL